MLRNLTKINNHDITLYMKDEMATVILSLSLQSVRWGLLFSSFQTISSLHFSRLSILT